MSKIEEAIKRHNLKGRTAEAVRLYLSGEVRSKSKAADLVGIHRSVVVRAVQRLVVTHPCPCCGADIEELQ